MRSRHTYNKFRDRPLHDIFNHVNSTGKSMQIGHNTSEVASYQYSRKASTVLYQQVRIDDWPNAPEQRVKPLSALLNPLSDIHFSVSIQIITGL